MSLRALSFLPTGGAQTHTLPNHVLSAVALLDIRGGGGGDIYGFGSQGGGTRWTGYLTVAASDVLTLSVGARGQAVAGAASAAGGWGLHLGGAGGARGSGTSAGGGGGGSSAVALNGALVVECGGGGGTGSPISSAFNPYTCGGNGGQDGFPACSYGGQEAGLRGLGGRTSGTPAFGAGGSGSTRGGGAGAAGNASAGGQGGTASSYSGTLGYGGGGGGGGYQSGGGGGGGPQSPDNVALVPVSGGGGGGSSYLNPAAVPLVANSFFYEGFQPGDGQILLTYYVTPTASITAPSGTIAATAEPPLVYTYAQADGNSQDRYWAKVFADPSPAMGGWPSGFDPETGDYPGGVLLPVWDSGETISGFVPGGIVPGTALQNGAYHAFLKVHDVDPGGVWSPWAQAAWTQNVPGPVVPTLTVNPQPGQARVQILLTSADNLLPTPQMASFEDGSTGGWVAQANCTLANTTAQFSDGSHALQVQAVASSAVMAVGEPSFIIGMVAGGQYSFQAQIRRTITAAAIAWLLQVSWYDAGGVLLAVAVGSPGTPTNTAWTTLSVTAIAPAGAARCTLAINTVSGTGVVGGDVYYLDAICLAAGPLGPFSPGGIPTVAWEVQRSADGGQTWVDVIGMAALAPPPLGSFQGYDREAPRECPLTYRARGTARVTGLTVVSAWRVATSRLGSDGNEWLGCLGDMTLDAPINRHGPDLVASASEDQATYWPEGRAEAVVIGGTIHSEQFSTGAQPLVLAFTSDAAWQTFVAVRARREPVLLRTVYGDVTGSGLEQFWLRLGDAGTTRTGGPYVLNRTGQIREVSVPAFVVGRPAP